MYLFLIKYITSLNITRNLEDYKYSVIQKYQVLIHLSPYFEAYVFYYERKILHRYLLYIVITQIFSSFLTITEMELAQLMNVLISVRLQPFSASQPLYILILFQFAVWK